jgi:signal transduction histidine kinase
VLAHGTPLVDEAGRFSGYIGACIDTSDLKAAQEREAFLARAGKVLASSLDYPATLGTVADLATPFLADACAVDMFTDEGGVERLAVAARDPERRARLIEAGTRWPPRLDTPGVLQEIARTRQPVLVSHVTDAMLVAAARDAEHLAVLRAIGVRSAIVAPFVARQGVFGAITLVIAESDRIYGEADLPVAEELAHRAATAIDNARLYEQAQTANSAKDDFLARLSHELRTPLNAALGWTMMLRGVTDPARLDRGLDVIDRNTRALARIIEDLLDFSRNVRGALRMEPVPIDLRAVTREAVASVEPMARHKGVALRSGAGGPVRIVGDPARLQQVAWNLLTNAIKFTPQGGQVAIEVSATPDGATLVFSDTGEGIRPELIDAIFDPFRQGDRHGTMGLGLGLAIVRQIVEAHGGTVEGRSAGAGAGATFTVRLPAVPSLTIAPADA